ncbi:MAG: DUF1786 domain-containing protein [Anaerolineales bacterium]|nr:DUF1786 domain-containing protein [Anaerolineales bacterium]
MRILSVDVGTGTQDIYLYDSRVDIENGFKLVVPSPTMMVHKRLNEATRRGDAIVLTGVTMGGGPSHWAARDHAKAGFPIYATPEAARTFDDDLARVEADGIKIISADEIATLPDSVTRLELRDFDFAAIRRAFGEFGASLDDLDAVAVAVFDHGAAPPDVSDRQFRFDYLDEHIRAKNRLSAFAFLADDVPSIMTRLGAVVDSSGDVDAPLMVMDTAPAAVLGATLDPRVQARSRALITNVGNFHTLAFRLGPKGIEGVFEHHTGLIDLPKLETLLKALAASSLKHEGVFGDHGHGALIYEQEPLVLGEGDFDVVVTGPRRNLFQEQGSKGEREHRPAPHSPQHPSPHAQLRPYFPAPFGDMMITGCFGLLAAVADVLPELSGPIRESLKGAGGSGTPPWEIA